MMLLMLCVTLTAADTFALLAITDCANAHELSKKAMEKNVVYLAITGTSL